MNRKFIVIISLLAVFSQSSYASDSSEFWNHVWLQGSVNLGYQQLNIDTDTETSKNGTSIGGRLLGEYRDENLGAFGFGIGFRQTSQEGTSATRSQIFVDSALTLDLSYLTPVLGKVLWVGGLVNNSIANGAHFDFGNTTTLQALISIGPQVRFQYSARSIDWVAGAELLYALNAPNRTIWQLPIYVGLSFPFNEPATACLAAAPVERIPASVVVPEVAVVPEAPAKVKIKLDARLVQFDVYKTTLTPESEAFLTKFANLLMTQKDNWSAIMISGHTDASGNAKKNKILSNGRAKTVMTWLIQQGVPPESLNAEGHGSDSLIPGFALNAPEHRRVELSFDGVSDGPKLQDAINNLNKNHTSAE